MKGGFMLRKDVQQGQCFRYTDEPSAYYIPKFDEGEELRVRILHTPGWYFGQKFPPKDRMDAEIVLLEHYSTHPKPTPVETAAQKLIKSFKVAVPQPIDPKKTYKALAAKAAMKMNNNDWQKDGMVLPAGKLSENESEAWRIELRLKIAEQKEKDKAAVKDKEIKVALEFDYWE